MDIDNKGLVVNVVDELVAKYGTDVYLLNSSANLTISQDRAEGFCEQCAKHGVDGSGRVFFSDACTEDD